MPHPRQSERRGKVVPLHPAWLHPQGRDVLVDVVVAPQTRCNRVVGLEGQRLRVQLVVAATDTHANAALVRFMAQSLGIAGAQVAVCAGPSSRRKTVRLQQVSPAQVVLHLTPKPR